MSMRRKLMLLLPVLILSLSFAFTVHTSHADSPPADMASGWYVQDRWSDSTTWPDGRVTSVAYRKGYTAAYTGSPHSVIIIDFGRQLYRASSGGWGVLVIGGNYHPNS